MYSRDIILSPQGIIITICVLLFALPYILNIPVFQFQSNFWKNNEDINNGEWYRLISAVFLHGGIFHLFINMYSLWNVSPITLRIFDIMGKNPVLVYLVIFFGAGICGNILSYYFNPYNSVGASGALFGLVGAIAAFAILKNQTEILYSVMTTIAINAVIGFLPGSGIDNYGHLGGFVGGFLLAIGFLVF